MRCRHGVGRPAAPLSEGIGAGRKAERNGITLIAHLQADQAGILSRPDNPANPRGTAENSASKIVFEGISPSCSQQFYSAFFAIP